MIEAMTAEVSPPPLWRYSLLLLLLPLLLLLLLPVKVFASGLNEYTEVLGERSLVSSEPL
jgi:hypothetical protein